jgi:membrane-associated phospholipid phosphatase
MIVRPWAYLMTALVTMTPIRAWGLSPERAENEYRPRLRPFNGYDYAGTALVSGSYYLVELTQDGPRGADWTKPLPLDRPLRDALAANSAAGRDSAHTASDVLWYASVAYPVLDGAITPWVRSGGPYFSWQMTMMNLQAFMTISLLVRMPHKWIGRTRPDALGCAKDPKYSRHCGSAGLFVSFPGGHVGVSMTGAGLSCAHHLHGELYGSKLADGAACSGALTAAALVGYFRMRADAHWFSDQLTGVALGAVSGYVLPTVLYYHPFWRAASGGARRAASENSRWTLRPLVGDGALGATFIWLD